MGLETAATAGAGFIAKKVFGKIAEPIKAPVGDEERENKLKQEDEAAALAKSEDQKKKSAAQAAMFNYSTTNNGSKLNTGSSRGRLLGRQ